MLRHLNLYYQITIHDTPKFGFGDIPSRVDRRKLETGEWGSFLVTDSSALTLSSNGATQGGWKCW